MKSNSLSPLSYSLLDLLCFIPESGRCDIVACYSWFQGLFVYRLCCLKAHVSPVFPSSIQPSIPLVKPLFYITFYAQCRVSLLLKQGENQGQTMSSHFPSFLYLLPSPLQDQSQTAVEQKAFEDHVAPRHISYL